MVHPSSLHVVLTAAGAKDLSVITDVAQRAADGTGVRG